VKKEFGWQKNQIQAFSQLLDLLCSKLILQYSNFTKPFVVTIDVSGYVIRGILNHDKIGQNLPIVYTSF
jgi:hypothetical protein